jgi:hypothetical protein
MLAALWHATDVSSVPRRGLVVIDGFRRIGSYPPRTEMHEKAMVLNVA